jgi:allantoin racemase
MKQILLINPNTSADTTGMMVAIARAALANEVSGQRGNSIGARAGHSSEVGSSARACVPDGIAVTGATARRGPPMITTPEALAAAADEVIAIGLREADGMSGIIVGAFGDPGLEALRRNLSIPAVGICEAAMLEAAAGGRRFGVATVTPDLVAPITERAAALGLLHLFTGIRLTPGDPVALTADPARLRQCLAEAVATCFDDDHAQAVIIGGGPLGQAATALAQLFAQPVIAPIPAAVRRLVALMGTRPAGGCP